MTSRHVLGMRVDCIEADAARDQIVEWAAVPHRRRRGPYICAANVHMTMEAHDDVAFQRVVNAADLVLADGQPIAWAMRLLGAPQLRRVRVTPDLVLELFAACEERGVKVGLYGGTPHTLAVFVRSLQRSFPRLDVPYAWSPPFRPLSRDEDASVVASIRKAGVQLLLVGIGCPKQERWMAAHTGVAGNDEGLLPCVMFGVGAAFDMLGGATGNAPAWTRDRGLEWAYRLISEPRRLWRRQLRYNPRFVALFLGQLLGGR